MSEVQTSTDTLSPTSSTTETPATSETPKLEAGSSLVTDAAAKVEAEAPSEAPKDETPKEEAAPFAPDYAALKLPEGVTLSEADTAELTPELAKLGISSQEQLQAALDLHAKFAQRAATAFRDNWNKINEGWINEIKADPTFGGNPEDPNSPLAKNVRAMVSVIDNPLLTPDPAAFKEALAMTGFGNNPAAIRTLSTWAKALSENGAHVQGKPTAQAQVSAAHALYPDLK